jgi:AraC-like DNA-binding protein
MALWPPLLAVQGPGDESAAHAHHTVHLVIARSGMLRYRLANDVDAREAAGVLTRADVVHAIDAHGLEVAILFADPESEAGVRLAASIDGDARAFTAAERDLLLEGLAEKPGNSALTAWMEIAVDRVAGQRSPARRVHPRVRRLLRRLHEDTSFDDLSLDRLAEEAGLSPSHFMHVFTESVGIPLRPYLRCLKVQRAALGIVSGTPLAQAAAEAGFTDAAHMSRTFREMFGLPPSVLQRRSQSVQAGGRRGAHD